MFEFHCPSCNAALRPEDLSIQVYLDIDYQKKPFDDNVGSLDGPYVTLTAKIAENFSEIGTLSIECWRCTWSEELGIDTAVDIDGPVAIKHRLIREVKQ